MTREMWDKAMLALAMWREARGEGREGMRAVGHVIMNRARAGHGDVSDAVCRRNQFSSISVHGDSQTTLWPTDGDLNWATACVLTEDIFTGDDLDITNGAIYYWNPDTASDASGWFRTNVATSPLMMKVATLGHHVFYKPIA